MFCTLVLWCYGWRKAFLHTFSLVQSTVEPFYISISITQAVEHNLTAFLDFSLAVHWQDRLSTLSNSVINTIQSLNPVAASSNQHCERVR